MQLVKGKPSSKARRQLHQPIPELAEAVAMPADDRRRKRNRVFAHGGSIYEGPWIVEDPEARRYRLAHRRAGRRII